MQNTTNHIHWSAEKDSCNFQYFNKHKGHENPEDIWNKDLHWPKPEEKGRNSTRTLMPYAITSNKWVDFHNEQQRKKDEKDETTRTRKLKREEKQNEEQFEKKKI